MPECFVFFLKWSCSPDECETLPPPAAAHPAPCPPYAPPRLFFPLMRGAGRGHSGGKQIIYKHFPKKKFTLTYTDAPTSSDSHRLRPEGGSLLGITLQEDIVKQNGYVMIILPVCLFKFSVAFAFFFSTVWLHYFTILSNHLNSLSRV